MLWETFTLFALAVKLKLTLIIDRLLLAEICHSGCAPTFIEVFPWSADASSVAASIPYHWSIIVGSTVGCLQ